MAATYVFQGPYPPKGEKWCTICARVFKGAFLALDSTQARVNEGNKLGPEETITFVMTFTGEDKDKKPPLNEAVTTAMVILPTIVEAPGQPPQPAPIAGPADVCWGHIQGLFVVAGSGSLQAYGPGDMPQERGAVVLGQKRGG